MKQYNQKQVDKQPENKSWAQYVQTNCEKYMAGTWCVEVLNKIKPLKVLFFTQMKTSTIR